MNVIQNTFGKAVLVLCMVIATTPSMAQDNKVFTTPDDVRAEITQVMNAISEYSAQERKQAIAEAREALNKLDAEIERREDAVRENWSDMSEATRDNMREQLRELRQLRNRVGERFGALQTGTESAWTELKGGFTDAWDAFAKAWNKADSGSN